MNYPNAFCPGIAKHGITATTIATLAIQTRHLADYAASAAKIGTNAITGVKIAALAVSTAKLSTAAATATKIANLAVGTVKLATAAATATKIANLSVGTGKLATNAVSTVKVLDYNISTQKIATNAVTTGKVLNGNLSLGAGTHLGNLGVIDGSYVSILMVTAGANHVVSHGLGRTPQGFLQISANKAAFAYNGTTAHTGTLLNLSIDTTVTTTFKLVAF